MMIIFIRPYAATCAHITASRSLPGHGKEYRNAEKLCASLGHAASLEDFSVLDRANNDFDLLIHESLLILRDRPSLNSQQSSIPLALF